MGYRAFGGRNTKATSDQANSLSMAHCDGGYMVFASLTEITDLFYTELFPSMYDTSDKSKFPSFVGSSYAGPNVRGPLKSDWTKACPLEWTQDERDEKCIPLQEAIHGTEALARLKAIKEAIDPNYMFDCYGCIGNNRAKSDDAKDIIKDIIEDIIEDNADGVSPTKIATSSSPTAKPTVFTSSAMAFSNDGQTVFRITLAGAFLYLL